MSRLRWRGRNRPLLPFLRVWKLCARPSLRLMRERLATGEVRAHGRTHARILDADPGKTRFETYCAGCRPNEGPFMMGEAPVRACHERLASDPLLQINFLVRDLKHPSL